MGLADKNKPAHFVERGDSKIDGPYLTDVNAARDASYTNSKVGKKTAKAAKKAAKKNTRKAK
jgi:hypothetical protein